MRAAIPGGTQTLWLILVESENVLPWYPRGQTDYGKINQTGVGMPLVSSACMQTFKKGGICDHGGTRFRLVNLSTLQMLDYPPPPWAQAHIPPPSSSRFPSTAHCPLPPVSPLALKPFAVWGHRCMSHPRRIPQARRAPRDGGETVEWINLSTSRSMAYKDLYFYEFFSEDISRCFTINCDHLCLKRRDFSGRKGVASQVASYLRKWCQIREENLRGGPTWLHRGSVAALEKSPAVAQDWEKKPSDAVGTSWKTKSQ